MKTLPLIPPEEEPLWRQEGWPFKPRNSYERKLLQDGKPPPKGRYGKRCRTCKSMDREIVYRKYLGKLVKGTRCAKCRQASNRRWDKANKAQRRARSRKSKERYRSLPPPNPTGPTDILTTHMREKCAGVKERCTEGEVFLVSYQGEPAYLLLPFSAYYDLPRKWRRGWNPKTTG